MYDTRNSDAIVRLAELTQKGELMWSLVVNVQEIPVFVSMEQRAIRSSSFSSAMVESLTQYLTHPNPKIFTAEYQGRILYLFKRTEKLGQTCLVIQEDGAFTTFPNVSALDDLYFVAEKQVTPRKGVESFVNDVLSPA
jgi:hypothetical protein